MVFETQLALFIACPVYRLPCSSLWVEISTLAYESNSSVAQKGCQWCTVYPYNSDKTNAQKSEISTKIDVRSYRSAHRCVSCSAGVICRGCGVVTCNKQLSVY